MGQIEQAEAALEAVNAEVAEIERQVAAHRQELAGIGKTTDPDREMRSDALRRVIGRLEAQLPRPNLEPDEARTLLQLKQEQAEQHLKDLQRRRDGILGRIEEGERLGGILTSDRFSCIDNGLTELERLLRDLGYHSSGEVYRGVLGVHRWLERQRKPVDDLANLRQHLDLLGEGGKNGGQDLYRLRADSTAG